MHRPGVLLNAIYEGLANCLWRKTVRDVGSRGSLHIASRLRVRQQLTDGHSEQLGRIGESDGFVLQLHQALQPDAGCDAGTSIRKRFHEF